MTGATFSGSRVLVTGGAGFVGGNLVRLLVGEGAAAVHVIDNLLSAERINVLVDPRVSFEEASIADEATVAGIADDYDFIFHLCTYHGNQSSIHDPLMDQEHNQLTTLRLFERAKKFARLRKLVYSGAGCAVAEKTFDAPGATPEDAPVSLAMDSPYSISKIVGEMYAIYYHAQHGLPAVRARFQNVYGPGEILGAGRWRGTPATVWRNVTPTFIYKALHHEALALDRGGVATRDFVYVDDICAGLMACALRGAPGEVYNLASGAETSIAALAEQIDALTGNPTPPSIQPGRSWDHSGRRYGSTEKARRALGFTTRVPLSDGLERTIAWTRENMPLIDRCIAKHAAKMSASQVA